MPHFPKRAVVSMAALYMITIMSVGAILGSGLSGQNLPSPKMEMTQSQVGNGIIGYLVPLYSYPNPTTRYDDLLALKNTYPNVPMGVIVNRANGAGLTPDLLLASYIDKFRAAGILVLGYVYTGSQPLGATPGFRNLIGSDNVTGANDQNRGTEQAIDAWASFYSLDGIYLDNGFWGNPNSPAPGYPGHTVLQYYQTAAAYAKATYGYKFVFGNPGGNPGVTTTGFVGSVDVINSIESATLDTPSQVAHYTTAIGGNASMWSMIANNNPTPPTVAYLKSVSSNIGWIYVSDTSAGANYQIEPSYQATTMANLASVEAGILSSSTVSSQTSTSLISNFSVANGPSFGTSTTTRVRLGFTTNVSTVISGSSLSTISTSTIVSQISTTSSAVTNLTSDASQSFEVTSTIYHTTTTVPTPNTSTSQTSTTELLATKALVLTTNILNTATLSTSQSSLRSNNDSTSTQISNLGLPGNGTEIAGSNAVPGDTSVRYGIIAYETGIIAVSPIALTCAKKQAHSNEKKDLHAWHW